MFRWLRRDPKPLVERRQLILRALADYPAYDPPHRQGPNFLRRPPDRSEVEHEILLRQFLKRADENFRYFLEQRAARMTALSEFLMKFDVKMELDDAGLASVSAWCPGHLGLLVANPRDDKTHQIFFQVLQPWTGQWRGLNVIFDLGIFLGEALIARSPNLRWGYHPGVSDDGTSNLSGYWIDGFRQARNWLDPMEFIYGECVTAEAHLRRKQRASFIRTDLLVGKVRDFAAR
jgi:hypothetical protein